MKRWTLLLLVLFWSAPASANPANCDGNLPPDKAELLELASGLNPLIWATVSILKTCEQVKTFISNLGVSGNTKLLSNAEIESALNSTTPSSTDKNASNGAAIQTLGQAEAKRTELISKDNELGADLLVICRSVTTEQKCIGRLLDIDTHSKNVLAWNKDPELMSFIPPIRLSSPSLVLQTGWEKRVGDGVWFNRAGEKLDREVCPSLLDQINGVVGTVSDQVRTLIGEFKKTCVTRDPAYAAWIPRWEAQLLKSESAKSAASQSRMPYVRPEDCKRLLSQISSELKAKPRHEPSSLEFYAAECASDPQSPEFNMVANWRQSIATYRGMDLLDQWDTAVSKTMAQEHNAKVEAQIIVARKVEEENRRIAAAKSAEEILQRKAEQKIRSENAAKPAKYETVCKRNMMKINETILDSGLRRTSGYIEMSHLLLKLSEPCVNHPEVQDVVNDSRMAIQNCKVKGACDGEYDPATQRYFNLVRTEFEKAFRDPNYSADLGPLKNERNNQSTQSTGITSKSTVNETTCEMALQKSERDLVPVVAKPPTGALASQQWLMGILQRQLAVVESSCPNSGRYAQMRQELRQQYKETADNCRQLKAGGGECIASGQ